jgi:peptidoglycan/LPS O-acetylase OafA/YrhL
MPQNVIREIKRRIATTFQYSPIPHEYPLTAEEDESLLEGQKELESPQKSSTSHIFMAFLLALIPSFITNRFRATEPRKLHPTSFLDGLRGFAAIVVVSGHLVLYLERWVMIAYGVQSQGNILQLPFIRLLVSPRAMVHIFFVISGYVLSCRHVKMIWAAEHQKLGGSLVSAVFRRGIRLFLPPLVQLVSMLIFAVLGLPDFREWDVSDASFGNLYKSSIGHLVSCWNWDEVDGELFQLWTIPVEFSCSMLLFLFVLGTSRLKTWIRLSVVIGVMVHCQAAGRYGPFEFLAGYLMADLEEYWSERELSGTTKRVHDAFWITCLLVGMFISGWPQLAAEETFGFKQLISWTPQAYLNRADPYLENGLIYVSFFWFSLAAPLMLWALFRVPVLQKPFTSRLALYCGDISYSIYIVHWYVVISLKEQIGNMLHGLNGESDTGLKRTLSAIFEAFVIVGLSVWYADVFWRLVDRPIVKFGRWLDQASQE